jgi:phospholipid-binding lipoprotein MlaA
MAGAAIAASLALAAAPVPPAAPDITAPVALAPAQAAPALPAEAPAAATPTPLPAAPADDLPADDLPADPAAPAAQITLPTQNPVDSASTDFDIAAPRIFPDPLEPLNRISYAITRPIDRFILRPLAITYKTVVPKPAREGARNLIGNASEPIVFVNDLLQLRPDRALRTLLRFVINSAIGVFGLFDIAKRKPFHLPHRNNSFGNTLGYYGIGPVAYLYLPVFGPTTLRDRIGQIGDAFVRDPLLDKALSPRSGRRVYRDSPQLGTTGTVIGVVEGLDLRAENDAELRTIQEDSIDPYAALRANFMQDRAGEIAALKSKDGVAPEVDGFRDPLIDPEESAPAARKAAQR